MPSTSYIDYTAAVASLQARTNAAGAAVTDVTGEELRLYASLFSPGVVQPTAFAVAPGAGLSVAVGSTDRTDLAVVRGGDPGQGNYLCRIGNTIPVPVSLAAADLSNPRIDQIFIVVQDVAYDGGTITMSRIGRRTGDPASVPVAPGPDAAWSAYLLLANVSVGAGATSVTAGNISDLRERSGMAIGGVSPVGVVSPYLGASAPSGWLLCQGQAVSRTTYAALYAVCGVVYGAGDGSTTFNLPSFQGRIPLGKATSGTGSVLGSVGGSLDHVHAGPSHTHTGPSHLHTMGTHNHLNAHTHPGASHTHPAASAGSGIGSTGSGGSHSHSFSDSFSTGVGTSSFSAAAGSFGIASLDSHTHSATASGTTGTGSHSHNTPDHTHAIDTDAPTSLGTTGNASSAVALADPGDTALGGTAATGASGTADTGVGNMAYQVVNYIVKT